MLPRPTSTPMKPHERVTDAYAETRIREKIATLPTKPRNGLARISADLQAAGVAPSARLHLVSAIADLGRLADATRPQRLARAEQTPRPREHDFAPEPWYKD